MKLFLKYIKYRLRYIGLFMIFALIFAVVFALYQIPIEAVIYPMLLCFAVGCIFIAIDFRQIVKTHKVLWEIKQLTAQMLGELPSPGSIADEDYQEILKVLRQEALDLESTEEMRYRNMIEYYTVWVHQIKTPIAAMRLTLQNEDTALSRQLLSDLLRIEQYVEMVLAFLRLDSSSSDYVFKEYDIDGIIKQAVRKFSSEFILRRITLDYKPTNKRIVTDEKWLSFVLEQILSNALKYTREGSIRIYLSEQNCLCIEDTGIGIAPEDLPRIFERGYTGYNGRTDKKASGIGLYLCKRICKNLSIDIYATSEVGRGTVIWLDMSQYRLNRD